MPILGLDDPEIRVEADLGREPALGLGRIDPVLAMDLGEHPVLAILQLALRRRPEHGGSPVQPIDLDEDRSGFRRAAAAQDGRRAFQRAAAQIGGNPDIGAQSHGFPRGLGDEPRHNVLCRGPRGLVDLPRTGRSF